MESDIIPVRALCTQQQARLKMHLKWPSEVAELLSLQRLVANIPLSIEEWLSASIFNRF